MNKPTRFVVWWMTICSIVCVVGLISSYAEKTQLMLGSLETEIAQLVEQVKPCVVRISAESKVEVLTPKHKAQSLYPHRIHTKDTGTHITKSKLGIGSGVIVDNRGYILTTEDVVKNAEKIKITIADGTQHDAELVGVDRLYNIALLKTDADKELSIVRFGNSDRLKIGAWVIILGYPYGTTPSVSFGIVSGLDRQLRGIVEESVGLIQMNVPVNPGDSGGPVINSRGELIGIVSAKYQGGMNGDIQAISFAIPSNRVKQVMQELIEKGCVTHGYLGVSIQQLTPWLAEHFGVPEKEGILISTVITDSPADKAGLKRGDVIIEYDGTKITDVDGLRKLVADTEIGKTVEIVVIRDGERKVINVEIGEMPDEIEKKVTQIPALPFGEKAEFYHFWDEAIKDIVKNNFEQFKHDIELKIHDYEDIKQQLKELEKSISEQLEQLRKDLSELKDKYKTEDLEEKEKF